MTEQMVREWLSDYATLSPAELHTFASGQAHNQELAHALHAVLEERNKYQELVDPVCDQLFSYYRSHETQLKHFAMQFVPTLIFVYLNAVAHGDKKSCRSMETLLLGMYNLEVVDESGQPKVLTYRFPSLAQASIYHEPMSLAPASLTEAALKRLEECNTNLVRWGPLPQAETLNAQNRLQVSTALLFVYNRHLSVLPKHALQQLCKVASKLVTQGFGKTGHQKRASYGSDSTFVPRLLPRIPVSAAFLLQMLHAVYFAITLPRPLSQLPHLLSSLTPTFYCHFSRFNDFAYIGTQALEDIYHRASHELYPDVLLVTGAIKNSLNVNPSGQPSDGPMGISVALSPSTATATVAKCVITNASFRTKKLPDDIPIQSNDPDAKNLSSISEEKEEEPDLSSRPGGSSGRSKALPKLPALPGFAKKNKDKEKDKGRNGVEPSRKPAKSMMNGEADKTEESGVVITSTANTMATDSIGGESVYSDSVDLSNSLEDVSKDGNGDIKVVTRVVVKDIGNAGGFHTTSV